MFVTSIAFQKNHAMDVKIAVAPYGAHALQFHRWQGILRITQHMLVLVARRPVCHHMFQGLSETARGKGAMIFDGIRGHAFHGLPLDFVCVRYFLLQLLE